jgi:predicted transcriptional regulator
MPIFRNNTQKQYTNIDNAIFSNRELKLKDRGILTTLLSLPDNWDFSVQGLYKILPDGKSAIEASLKRIEKQGYLTRRVIRDENGRYSDYEWEIHETPQAKHLNVVPKPENQDTGYPKMGYPNTENPDTDNKPQSITKVSNNKTSINTESVLSESDFNELVLLFGKELVDFQINKVKEKGYKNCLNKNTIGQWCSDFKVKPAQIKRKNNFNNFDQRQYSQEDYNNIERALINR